MNGGAERVLLNLVNNMDFKKFDISVKTVMNVGRYQALLDKRIKYSYIFSSLRRGTSWYFKLFSPETLYNRYIGNDYDIVVSYLEGMTSRIISGCTKHNVKKIAWIHIEIWDSQVLRHDFRSLSEAIKCYRSFDDIICVSNNVKNCFDKLTGLSAKTRVLYNTNNTADIQEKMKEDVTDVMFSPEEINICSVAKIVFAKGFDRLARIQRRLREQGLKTHIYILGEGDEQAKISEYLKDNNLSEYFTFLGYRENPYKYMARCDLYVCSSRREGFSTAVSEALIVGLPVVSTRCSGAEELLGSNNEYGIVTDNSEEALYNGLVKMIENDDNLTYYKKAAIERGKNFSTEATVRSVTELLMS